MSAVIHFQRETAICSICGHNDGTHYDPDHNEWIRRNSIRIEVWAEYVRRARLALGNRVPASDIIESFVLEGQPAWRARRFIWEARRTVLLPVSSEQDSSRGVQVARGRQ